MGCYLFTEFAVTGTTLSIKAEGPAAVGRDSLQFVESSKVTY